MTRWGAIRLAFAEARTIADSCVPLLAALDPAVPALLHPIRWL
jgi:hypothetical protein